MIRLRTLVSAVLALALLPALASAQAYIRRPNAHMPYDVEVDPHLVVQWDHEPPDHDQGLGLGVHVSIPVIANGPIPTINNSLAVKVGLDWAYFGDDCDLRGRPVYESCSANTFVLPVTAQWNFYFSEVISAFPELGLAVQHTRWDDSVCYRNGGYVTCGISGSRTRVQLAAWLGMRVHLEDTFALTLRIGTPSLLLGVSFLL